MSLDALMPGFPALAKSDMACIITSNIFHLFDTICFFLVSGNESKVCQSFGMPRDMEYDGHQLV